MNSATPGPRKKKNIVLVFVALLVSACGLLLYAMITAQERGMLGGSKSAPAATPLVVGPQSDAYENERFFPSSKSGSVVSRPRKIPDTTN